MRIDSLPLERYPFCARRCLSKKKRKRNWEGIEWFTQSKLIVLPGEGDVPLQETNGDVSMDGVAFSRPEWL